MRVLDMHAHLSCLTEEYGRGLSEKEKDELGLRELELRRQKGIATFFSSGTPEEWEFMRHCMNRDEIRTGDKIRRKSELRRNTERESSSERTQKLFWLSFGIHPWYSDRYRPENYRDNMEQCDAVGEIGMDSVWCDVPLSVQHRCLQRQLELAAELKKPVILHTKGQEAEIARMVRDFPGKVCVHWYSGDVSSMEAFLEMGCYFTLGPDLAFSCSGKKEPAEGLYREMLQKIPADHLFIETDGISAVAWARGIEYLELTEIPAVLEKNLAYAAAKKGMTAEKMRERMRQNLLEFLGTVSLSKGRSARSECPSP